MIKFKCIICGHDEGAETRFRPRDRKELKIFDCSRCGHRQLFPLLSEEELAEEYNEDKTVRSDTVKIAPGSDFESMRMKFSEWTKIHADMYWDKLQECKNVLNIGSGYGFLEEELNKRPGKRFNIEGDDIGQIRIDNYVGGVCHNINFMNMKIPDKMIGKYDMVMGLHILEHINAPVEYLSKLKPLFSEKGKLLIEVPNLNCYLCELSPEYSEFFYLYEHVSYFTIDTLKETIQNAGYIIEDIYTRELYSVENHINWIRNGKPFIRYNQMFLPDDRIEFINEEYKRIVGEMGKGYALIVEARCK
jgi:2-polyprenyl-3-methyl-5-hydroxy-6-metoxy-1,4-benzoquinol methylase